MNADCHSRKKRGERGQSIAEFALILPVLLLLFVGMIEFGRILEAKLILTSAAQEGARYGALGKTTTEIEQGVRQAASHLNSPDLVVSVTNPQGPSGEAVTVQVSHPITVSTPLIADVLPSNPVLVTAAATMRIE